MIHTFIPGHIILWIPNKICFMSQLSFPRVKILTPNSIINMVLNLIIHSRFSESALSILHNCWWKKYNYFNKTSLPQYWTFSLFQGENIRYCNVIYYILASSIKNIWLQNLYGHWTVTIFNLLQVKAGE